MERGLLFSMGPLPKPMKARGDRRLYHFNARTTAADRVKCNKCARQELWRVCGQKFLRALSNQAIDFFSDCNQLRRVFLAVLIELSPRARMQIFVFWSF